VEEGNEGSGSDARLAHYSTLFKRHFMLKLEALAWRYKMGKREAKWNELNAKLNILLEMMPYLPYHMKPLTISSLQHTIESSPSFSHMFCPTIPLVVQITTLLRQALRRRLPSKPLQ
jgi:hypothetical protein